MTDVPDYAQALTAEVAQRIAERRTAAMEKQRARRAVRAQLAARRNAGLEKRHAAKLAHIEGDQS